MLSITHLTYLVGGRPLFQDASLQIFAGQRVGLVGKNGCGKSTLFRLIRGELRPDGGDIALQAGKTLAFVEQEISNSDKPALEFVLDGDSELRALEAVLTRDEHDSARHDAAWFEAQQRFEAIEGYAAPARAAQLLAGLGFAPEQLQRPVASFSGGWRMRLNLARALMKRADLLLLDEPTNHLDLEAIIWLEQYLARYPGSLLIVSHDREFLNACVNRIAHITSQAIELYTGSYDDFERARAERAAQQNEALRQQQAKIAHLEDFVRRFRAKATKAKQAQSRLKALERLERIAPAHVEDGHFDLEIEAPERSPDTLLRAEQLAFGYGEKALLTNVNLVLRAGARIALLGPNGAGKSTLIKLLAGELTPTRGRLEITPGIHIGYFAQHQLENLDLTATPLTHLERIAPDTPSQQLRDFLGRFGLAGASEDRPVGGFSGGEKSRLALALLAWTRPHLLLLDEPTNHLDLDMRDALTVALEDYAGAMVLVSHDRSLIRACADELWLVADGTAAPFDGDLEDYRAWVEARRMPAATPAPASAQKAERAAPVRRKALLSRQAKLEDELEAAQAKLAAVQARLADPATYAVPGNPEIAGLNREREILEAKIPELENAWLDLASALEQAG
jgi:ATP-binding cassette subfamily F protein 3